MGSATKHALRTLKGEVDRAAGATLATGAELFDAIDVIVQQSQLRQALADASADAAAKRAVVERVFGARFDPRAVSLIASASTQRWSNESEFALGLQELGVRAVSQFSGEHDRISQELQGFLDVVTSNPDLELTLGSKLSDPEGKRRIIDRVFASHLGEATLTILRHLVSLPAGRRTRRLVGWAQDIVADQASRQVATVTVARPIDEAQFARLQGALARHFGRPVTIAQVVDPAVIGGLRVQFGDDVIDSTVQSKLGHLRRQFA
ncbi:ATP synthase subunit delta [Pseudoclavibacter endophyticus]|uniref:ATP synthase subunit delta n=1 Tax=Pseudoclavibacter endophyticus TaxID=1778590 RepID=A0A6H9WQB0_9MICO|nr:F0F1 ATP synthase subunit delta [Pseudoclavibacter endophyticus]KAB1649891.1 F0F1 ATP synthase subunit delta [Pseudoclavibacter endophyticus]GGA58943.1 ATP synthase subunit delta [Pseudoclavibacter endophyticus]